MRLACALILLGLAGSTVPGTFAHEDPETLLPALEGRLPSDPVDRLEMLLTRAALRLELGRPGPARADLEEALLLAPPGHAGPQLALAHLEVIQGHPERALALLEGAEADSGLSPAVWSLRAEAWRDAGSPEIALAAARRAIDLRPLPGPEDYLLLGDLTLAAGGDGAAAVTALEEGLSRLGPVPCLLEAALFLDLQRGDEEAALRRLDRMDPGRERADLLARRGDLLLSWGRIPEAWVAYTEARSALEGLPLPRRDTPGARALALHLAEVLSDPSPEETR